MTAPTILLPLVAGSSLVELLITGLLSGGLVGAVAAVYTSRATAHKSASEAKAVDAKLPVEVDSIAVQGAESAVMTMKAALDSATSRIAQLEAERAADRARIIELEAKVEDLRSKVEAAETALGTARRAGEELRAELEAFMADHGRRS